MHPAGNARLWTGIASATLALAAVAWGPGRARADQPEQRLEFGVVGRFMPTGWFQWEDHTPSSLRAYPAVGGAPFVDWRLDRFFSVGFMPELTLNVIPKITDYPISAMLSGSLRLKAQYPEWRHVVPYVLLAPGYSVLFRYGEVQGGDGHGFSLGVYGGLRVPVSKRNAILAEGGYLRGFLSDGGQTYAPSYVVIALGWELTP
jgi:hypothetical protein